MSDSDVVQPNAGDNSVAEPESVNTSDTDQGVNSDNPSPQAEVRDGKLYVDGVRVYTRDDTNRIAANTRRDTQQSILSELGVDDIEQVKSVINTLQETTPGQDLNVESLRETVKRREQTVEELQTELATLKTQMVMDQHLAELRKQMPGTWNSEQQQAVVDLMRARNMFELQDTQFAIRHNGELLLDDSGERPDYAQAVQIVGKTLGLPGARQGITSEESPPEPGRQSSRKGLDTDKLNSDPAYRAAYVTLRQNRNLSRDQITHDMVLKNMERAGGGTGLRLQPSLSATTTSKRRTK